MHRTSIGKPKCAARCRWFKRLPPDHASGLLAIQPTWPLGIGSVICAERFTRRLIHLFHPLNNLSSERSRLLYSARNRVNGAQVCLSTDNWIARSLYISSTVWACPIYSTSCRLKGPRLANGSGHNGQLFRSVQNLLAIIMKILLTISFAKF